MGGRLRPPIGFVSLKKIPDYTTKMSIENMTANGSSLQFMKIKITTNIFAVHSAPATILKAEAAAVSLLVASTQKRGFMKRRDLSSFFFP